MAWPIIGGIIAAGASAYSTWKQAQIAKRNTDKQNRANRELAEYAYSRDLEMWQKQNEYNRPSAQMQRFGDAGLNPNLMYGQGTPGNAAQMAHYNAPRMEYNYKPDVDPLGALSAYIDMAQKSSQNQLTQQQLKTEAYRTWLVESQDLGVRIDNKIRDLENQLFEETFSEKVSILRNQADSSLSIAAYDAARAAIEQKRKEWAQQGFTPNDSSWLRLTAEFLQEMGVDRDRIKKLISPYLK